MLRKASAFICWGVLCLGGIAAAQDQERSWRLTWTDRDYENPQMSESFRTQQAAEQYRNQLIATDEQAAKHGVPRTRSNFQIAQINAASRKTDDSGITYSGEALRSLRERMQKRNGRIGDALRDYSKVVRNSISHAKQLRSTMLSKTENIERDAFNQVNKQIEQLNQQAEDFNQFVAAPDVILQLQRENDGRIIGPQDYPQIEAVDALLTTQLRGTLVEEASGSSSGLAGKQGAGRFGTSSMRVEFRDGGVVVFYDAESRTVVLTKGTYSQIGNTVTLETDNFTYTGTLNGDTLQGTRTGRGSTDRSAEGWRVTLAAGARSDDVSHAQSRDLTSFSTSMVPQTVATVLSSNHQHTGNSNYGYSHGQSRSGGLDWDTFHSFRMQSNALMNNGSGYQSSRPQMSQPRMPQFTLPPPTTLHIPGSGGSSGGRGRIIMDESRRYSR